MKNLKKHIFSILFLQERGSLKVHKLLNQVFCISILYFSLIPTGLNAGYVDKINNNSSFSDSLNLNLLTNEQFDQFVNKKISSMSLKDKIGQLFILGFHGTK